MQILYVTINLIEILPFIFVVSLEDLLNYY